MARSEQDKQMERIAALLERAEDENNSEQERESAARMAERLGAKHSIDFAVARMHSREKNEYDDQIVSREVEMPYKSGNTRDQGWIALMVELAYANEVWVLWKSNKLNVRGVKFDVEFAISLFRVLVTDQEVKAIEYAKIKRSEGSRKSVQNLKDSFRLGYRKRVRERIEDLRSERMMEIDQESGLTSGSTALALRDRAAETDAAAHAAMEEANVKEIGSSQFAVRNVDHDAREQGDLAGSTVTLVASTQIERGKREID